VIRRVPWSLAALPALGIARLLPEGGAGLWFRLAAATACLLLPGALLARAVRVPGPSAAIASSLALLFGASAVMFAVHGSLWLALGVLAAAGAATLGAVLARGARDTEPRSRRAPGAPRADDEDDDPFWPGERELAARAARAARDTEPRSRTTPGPGAPKDRDTVLRGWTGDRAVPAAVALAGIGFGIALWFVTRHLSGGDDLFHLARVRKLDAFGSLTLRTVDEFRDGGLHPGYAFPLWHVFLALVGRVGGVDAAPVVVHESSVLVPLAFLVAWESGAAAFRSAWGGVSVLLAQAAIIGLAAGSGGSYKALDLPATLSRQLLVPVVIALFFHWLERRSVAALGVLAAGALALAVVHPTYAVFLLLPLAGYVAARALLARTELVGGAVALVAVAVPTVAYALWVRPLAQETASVDPTRAEVTRALSHYRGQLDVLSDHRYRLAPEVVGRSGAVAVCALLCVPLALFGAKRRWGALVLGGSVAVLVVMLVPELFVRFSDAVSISQSRRAAGFVPFAFVVAGVAAVLVRLLSLGALPVALIAGVAFQLSWPGDFGYSLTQGGPAIATWVALVGGALALVAGIVLPRRLAELDSRGGLAALAAGLFVLPVALHGFTHWRERPTIGVRLPPALVRALREHVPNGAVVFSDPVTSYRIAAALPVYVANAPPGHVADTKANRPYARRDDAKRYFKTGDPRILRRYGASWLVIDHRRNKTVLRDVRRVWHGDRYDLYRLRSPA